jgi:dihydroorotase (multifunctional complex type)
MSIDLLIKNGILFTAGGWVEADLLADGGKIVGIRKSVQDAADEVIDASGKYVVPGLIDAHIHLRDPGYTHKEDYATGTMAAAAGGVTTVFDQPNTNPVPNDVERYKAHIANAGSKAYVDFNSMASPSKPAEIQALSELGTVGFKIFQKKTVYPYDTEASIPESDRILEAFTEIAKTGKPCAVHPHSNEIYESLIRKAKEQGSLDARRFCEITGNELVYSTGASQLFYFQEKTGVTYYALHCHYRSYIDMVRRAKKRGAKVIADCIYLRLVPPDLDKFDILRNHLSIGRTQDDQDAMWEGVLDGTIDFIDTDHAPHTVEEIKRGLENPQRMALGYPGVEHYFSIMLTEVNKGRISLRRLIELLSVNPAKIFGLYPQKGSLDVGTDADIAIVDLEKESTISGENLYTKAGWTPFEGRRVKGISTHTIVRGKVVAAHGKVVGEKGHGIFVPARAARFAPEKNTLPWD